MRENNLAKWSLALLLSACLYATDTTGVDGKYYFDIRQYDKALPLLKTEAQKGSKPSMYRLAHMYEHGLGVETDHEKATAWYRRAASSYSYVLDSQETNTTQQPFSERLSDQLEPKTNREGAAYALQKMDTSTEETGRLLNSILDGDFFGLQPYKSNYFIPLSYATHKYPRITSDTYYDPDSPDGYYGQNSEVEFQLSLKKPLTYNLLGWHEALVFGYTQRVWWQLYTPSAPFRETNYMPEIYLNLPTSEHVDETYGLKAVKFGFIHESNGQEGYRSRSWNRLYVTGQWQWKNLFLGSRVWYRMSEGKKYTGYYDGLADPATGVVDPNASGDDNPDIEKYLGYGDIKIDYLHLKNQFGALFRYNFGAGGRNRGAVELNWSYPFFNSENTFWYLKLFSGYGESLIDYDRSVTKSAFGFSFSRGLY